MEASKVLKRSAHTLSNGSRAHAPPRGQPDSFGKKFLPRLVLRQAFPAMLPLLVCAAIGGAIIVAFIYSAFRVPSGLPKSVPTVPIYVNLIPAWASLGGDEIYDRWLRQPLEEHGVIKMWYRGYWSILTTRPDLLSFLFRNEEHLIAKCGNFTKLPWSVIAALVGDNVLGAHGEPWKLMSSIMKPGVQKAFQESRPFLENSRRFVNLLLQTLAEGHPDGVKVQPLIQRLTLDIMGEALFDAQLGVRDSAIDSCYYY